jgi:UDP-N-acetylmuramoyl-tripeptide--D-alanyl-D-alanine ligase
MARNALAATGARSPAGASLDAVKQGLEGFRAVAGRLVARHAMHGALVLDDTYNANPDSMRAAIDVLAAAPGAPCLVMGDMGEVGEQGPAFPSRDRRIRARARRRAPVCAGHAGPRGGRRVRRRRASLRRRRALIAAVSRDAYAGHDDAREGLALHADGARGRAPRRGKRGAH